MKIRPLGNSIAGLNSYGASAPTTQQTETEGSKLKAANQDAASVKLQRVGADPAADRAELVKKLKEQVQSGSYQPKSEDVATAIARDLL